MEGRWISLQHHDTFPSSFLHVAFSLRELHVFQNDDPFVGNFQSSFKGTLPTQKHRELFRELSKGNRGACPLLWASLQTLEVVEFLLNSFKLLFFDMLFHNNPFDLSSWDGRLLVTLKEDMSRVEREIVSTKKSSFAREIRCSSIYDPQNSVFVLKF